MDVARLLHAWFGPSNLSWFAVMQGLCVLHVCQADLDYVEMNKHAAGEMAFCAFVDLCIVSWSGF